MRNAPLSLLAWAGYQVLVGVPLLLVPELMLGILQVETTDTVWVRIIGALILGLAYYNLEVARSKSAPLMRVSVVVRLFVALTVVVVVVLGLVPPTMLLLAAVEGAAAGWTEYALGWPRGATGEGDASGRG
jgi:hypothetical protein